MTEQMHSTKKKVQTYNEAVKNDKTGAFTQGATAKPEDVGYYFDNDGVIFFVNEGVVAPASSGLVTVERLN